MINVRGQRFVTLGVDVMSPSTKDVRYEASRCGGRYYLAGRRSPRQALHSFC